MNRIPKFVASTTLRDTTWNATVIEGEVAAFVADLKQRGRNLLKYGNGPLDATLMEHGLVDEFHLFVTPVAIGRGQHLFEDIDWAPHLNLVDVTRFSSGVIVLVYAPK
jgi:dihydrofolate reductase